MVKTMNNKVYNTEDWSSKASYMYQMDKNSILGVR